MAVLTKPQAIRINASPSNCDCDYARGNYCDCEVCCVSSISGFCPGELPEPIEPDEEAEGPFKRPPEEPSAKADEDDAEGDYGWLGEGEGMPYPEPSTGGEEQIGGGSTK